MRANGCDPEKMPQLWARDLTLRYPGASKPALAGLSLEVNRGEIFGLLGPNGAGKSTAIGVLCTLLTADTGEVEIRALNLRTQKKKVRSLIGLVPQDIALYPSLTIRENLSYFGTLHGLKGESLRQRVDECLALTGLEQHARRRIQTCSGGIKRRANLAAGIVHRPELLFLDEPTVGIDAQSRHMILCNLQELKRSGMTMIYTTHYMEEAQQLCARIAIMDQGQMIAQGEPEHLMAVQGCSDLQELFLHLTGRSLRD
ncbi:MAG: ABC transporter ATP-binding protein [Desulfuromonadaceae bacterium]|nr:ABC transporter ATP-binding protein [Desulfuromonadaceae bacterium]